MVDKKYPARYHKKRAMWTMSNAAAFTMRDKSIRCCNNPTVLVNLPSYNSLVGNQDGVNNTRFERIMIKMKDEKNMDDVNTIKKAFKTNFTED